MVLFDVVTGGNRILRNSGGVTNLSESFEVLLSFSFCRCKTHHNSSNWLFLLRQKYVVTQYKVKL